MVVFTILSGSTGQSADLIGQSADRRSDGLKEQSQYAIHTCMNLLYFFLTLDLCRVKLVNLQFDIYCVL